MSEFERTDRDFQVMLQRQLNQYKEYLGRIIPQTLSHAERAREDESSNKKLSKMSTEGKIYRNLGDICIYLSINKRSLINQTRLNSSDCLNFVSHRNLKW